MSSLSMSNSISPTLTGVILATALGSASFNSYASYLNNVHSSDTFHKTQELDLSKTSQTFSAISIDKDHEEVEIDNLMIEFFEKISKNSKPLDPEFAKILSDNMLDLF